MLRPKFLIAGGALIIGALLSTGGVGADDIPDDVSQHSHNSYAVGGWHFDEPDGSTGLTVQVSDEFTIAPHGLQFRAKSLCVGILHSGKRRDDGEFGFVWGCKELNKSEFDFDSRLDDAFVSTSVPVECMAGSQCFSAPDAVDVDLWWTGGDPLLLTNGVSRNEECQIHRRDEFRPAMEVRGSVSDGAVDFTHGVAGSGAMESVNRTALVVGEPTDCS